MIGNVNYEKETFLFTMLMDRVANTTIYISQSYRFIERKLNIFYFLIVGCGYYTLVDNQKVHYRVETCIKRLYQKKLAIY